jgi:thymidylate kinase
MNVIIEGCDAMGKGTQIALIEKEFEKLAKAVHIVHYSNIKLETNDAIKVASQIRYREMFRLMSVVPNENVLIFDRAHLGETVYSPIYRNYSGDFVFDYERDYVNHNNPVTKLIVFTDTPEAVIERDKKRGDGLSFSLDIDKKKQELAAFERAYEMSSLDKKLIHLNGRTPEEIWEQDVYPFIFGDM